MQTRSQTLKLRMRHNNLITPSPSLDSVAAPPKKKLRKSVASFIRLEKEDWYRPSLSGLELLNCRTFIEGLRLTVVRGDITEANTDVIVVPSDERLSLSGMVGSAVRQKAGPAFVTEVNNAQRYDPIKANSTVQRPQAPQLPANTVRLINTGGARKTIREIAAAANIPYLTAFYKVVKKENISATKDMICLDAMGVYHRGPAARTFLGLPAVGKDSSIALRQIPAGAEVFVQNTSHNRKIPNNSSVLLEMPTSFTTPPPPPTPVVASLPLKTSDVCVVNGHNLQAAHAMFVVSPHFSQQPSREAAKQALKLAAKNALRECSRLQLETITLPSIGSGVAGYNKADAAGWIIDAIAEYLEEASSSPWHTRQSLREVCFCLFDDESLEAYRRGILAREN